MQYVRSISGSVSKTWNSINPATLSGAIDVIVVEREDGTLACSPFHVRFGKFQLLRPSNKKVEFIVNGIRRQIPMKVGEGGEAFFVFETTEKTPRSLQTSPLISPAASPESVPQNAPPWQEPEPLELTKGSSSSPSSTLLENAASIGRPKSADAALPSWPLEPNGNNNHENDNADFLSDMVLRSRTSLSQPRPQTLQYLYNESSATSNSSPPPGSSNTDTDTDVDHEPYNRAVKLSRRLGQAKVPTIVSPSGDLMLDMSNFQGEEAALTAEATARRILSEESAQNFDIGSLIGMDEKGQIWIYRSEEAKEAADKSAGLRTLNPDAALRSAGLHSLNPSALRSTDAVSDPGYHSDDNQSEISSNDNHQAPLNATINSDNPTSMPITNYAKSLRLTNEQLKSLDLKPGSNTMTFAVNKAACQAFIYYWHHDTPIIISDIDGTITKSDALGHMLTMFSLDWTHKGVAKLYTDIAANGYHILYLTSRSVGQADSTRGYLNWVFQDGYRLPKGPVILSPDRTMAALRREVYLRKPEVFKMACLRDIMNLYLADEQILQANSADTSLHQITPYYAGFGNRLTDALSYRSVAIPPTRIFTINSEAKISLHLLTLNNYTTDYMDMRQLVDHYFPSVGLLAKDGGGEFSDFNYWRDKPNLDFEFSDSESENDYPRANVAQSDYLGDGDGDDHELFDDDERPFVLDDDSSIQSEDMEASFMSQSFDESRQLETVDEEQDFECQGPRFRPEAILEEEEISNADANEYYDHDGGDGDDENKSSKSRISITGDVLVEASRQIEALNLEAEEQQPGPPKPMRRYYSAVAEQSVEKSANELREEIFPGDSESLQEDS